MPQSFHHIYFRLKLWKTAKMQHNYLFFMHHSIITAFYPLSYVNPTLLLDAIL